MKGSDRDEQQSLRAHLGDIAANPARLSSYVTACSVAMANAYYFGFWSQLGVTSPGFPDNFWSLADMVSASLWSIVPAIAIPFLIVWMWEAVKDMRGRYLRSFFRGAVAISLVELNRFAVRWHC
jgi:hypothetical protein